MNKVLIAAALALMLSPTGKALAQTIQYETEVCVNASQAAEAKRRFPNAVLHVIPDDVDANRNGWRITIHPEGKRMSDAEEIRLRGQERYRFGWEE